MKAVNTFLSREETDEASTPKKQKLDKSVTSGVSVSTPKRLEICVVQDITMCNIEFYAMPFQSN